MNELLLYVIIVNKVINLKMMQIIIMIVLTFISSLKSQPNQARKLTYHEIINLNSINNT